jgi:hypothetical protein
MSRPPANEPLAEIIVNGAHSTREVVDGVYIWSDNLPCDPECEPAKGIHVVRGTEDGLDPGRMDWSASRLGRRAPRVR